MEINEQIWNLTDKVIKLSKKVDYLERKINKGDTYEELLKKFKNNEPMRPEDILLFSILEEPPGRK
jgi:uncharacterized coiled-coil DUF342 family protein